MSGGQNGIRSDSLGTTNIIANDKNKVNGNVNGIYTTEKGVINLEAGVSNIINNNVVSFGKIDGPYGREIIDENDEDIIGISINNKIIYLKRYYG